MNLYHKLLWSLVVLTVSIILFASLGLSATPLDNKEIPNGNLNPAINPASRYKGVCGKCHMPYPPDFLPSSSWEMILESPENHFETSLDIDLQTKNRIVQYLKENGAERSEANLSMKIIQSLDGNLPIRLTEVPYLLKKHRKIASNVFQRRSIGSFSNCSACHLSADNWIFNKRVKIPK